MKKFLKMTTLATALSLALVGCGSEEKTEQVSATPKTEDAKQIVLDLSIPEPEGAKFDIAAQAFREELEKLTDHQMTVKVHYNNSLGGEREVFELMGMGSLDMAIQSAGPMGNWVKEFNMFDLPFLFDNKDHAHAVLDGEIGNELAQKFEQAANVKILGWVENGFVATSSNGAINSVEDVKGMKIRVQENELQIDAWKSYGADATPMAWTEVFTGLQQGVIDGHSNSLATIQSSKIYEVQSHVALLEDRFSPGPISISKSVFDGLTPEQQEAVVKAAEYAEPIGRQANDDKIAEAAKFITENGVEITEPDKESFKAKTAAVYEKWAPIIGEEIIEKVKNTKY
ncbi:TRAP transporter substrate-binding protein [Schinkia azotoformans]|uniref:TRAP transporter substrate-binding protein n=1 Tax=Schinkia azotoformans LMG 9581 TaxID=1131731 RepID=K6D5C1_SCHAZ|nr:TRAP transporter substrate-binding protein [Schinkia azotoformans]EKN63248.1 TRAP transporter substrate-binding protein [Schinkia azotoformans LMG 9581]MEC1637202.1 TRAP transporter substrate-binding protein [Schinkia azotoformans]MEC1720650.1 TRAP transporter substrate-binding protein [Schinkia azotoformans]MEC1943606.1 TRAP transporter substrate-binding protein [Schinkia azotoformans]MED4411789.1 TRAP transporter substrate-binding protein [Schinkia azotoformans]